MEIFKVLVFAGSFQALLLAFYFFFHPGVAGIKIFGLLLLISGLHLGLVANDNQAFFMQFPHLLHISWILPAFYGPFTLIFVRRISRYQLTFSWRETIFFLPALLLIFAEMDFFLLSAQAKQAYIQDFGASLKDDFGFHNEVVSWLHVIYFGLSLWLLKKYRNVISQYAATEESRLTWLNQYLVIALSVIIFGLLAFYGKKFEVIYLKLIYPHHFLLVILLIYWSAYRLLKQPVIFNQDEQIDTALTQTASDEERKIQPYHMELANKIRQLMEVEELYKKPGLTLYDLVVKLNSNKQYVSESINLVIGKSFYDYVNELRLKDFTEQIKSPGHHRFSLLGMALNAGFNSKATFNAVFKKYYGMAPSNFYKNQLNEMELSPN